MIGTTLVLACGKETYMLKSAHERSSLTYRY
jgi:hypothetical protein